MNFEEEEEWDLELLDKLVQTEEQALAARRSASQPAPFPLPPSPLSLSLRKVPRQPLLAQDDPPPLVLDLQQRLLQAEQELTELRQKELRRLQSEILFKDQEILEARRACTEKSEELKRTVAENEELRKGFEDLKRLKGQSNGSAKAKPKKGEWKENEPTILRTNLADDTDGKGPPKQDFWCPPWTLSGRMGSLQCASKSNIASPQAVQLQCTYLEREDPVSVQELQARVLDNGCSSLSEKEIKISSGQSQQVEMARISTNGGNIQGNNDTWMEQVIDKNCSKHLFLSNALNIWCPRSMKDESKGLLSKVLAVCEADMQVLVSMDSVEAGISQYLTKNRNFCETSPFISKRASLDCLGDGIEGGSASSGTHSLLSIIAKVMNGVVSSWNLFVNLLELCEVDNIQVSESALRVLHCILIHDEGCQSRIFGRNCFGPTQSRQEFQKSVGADWFCTGTVDSNASVRSFERLFGADTPAHVLKRYSSSPRISWHNKDFPQCQKSVQDILSPKSRGLEINDISSHQSNSRSITSVDCNQGAWSARIFKRILVKAVMGSSEAIKITAMSILVALAMNAEPICEREQFGFILLDGTMASLLGLTAGLDMRLQAVRLIHSLLHCPPVLKKLFDMQDQAWASLTSKEPGGNGEPMQEYEFDARNSEDNVVFQNGKEMNAQFETAGEATEKCSLEVLEGLISCLLHGDRKRQAYSLKRNALRVLTFLATSGQQGAAFLLARKMALNKATSLKKEGDSIQDSKCSAIVSGTLPVHLVVLLDQEVKTDENKCSVITSGEIEEKEYVIHEALTLLCRLASHPTESSNTLAALTVDKDIARLSVSVTNRLMSSGALSEMPTFRGRSITSPVDMIELCRGLRRRILAKISNL